MSAQVAVDNYGCSARPVEARAVHQETLIAPPVGQALITRAVRRQEKVHRKFLRFQVGCVTTQLTLRLPAVSRGAKQRKNDRFYDLQFHIGDLQRNIFGLLVMHERSDLPSFTRGLRRIF